MTLLCAPYSAAALLGTRWALNLDIGQEPGTWMPPRWGSSGARATARPVVAFAADGQLELIETGAWDHLTMQLNVKDGVVGGWEQQPNEERVCFWLEHEGVERGDVMLEPGRIYGNAGAWGSQLGRRGSLTIKQRKLGWIPFVPTPSEASFIVGTFSTTSVPAPNADREQTS